MLRFAKGRGPFTTGQANEHFGRDVEQQLRELEREEKLIRGELRPGGTEREWCDPDVLRRLRRASLAALRKEVEPAEQATLGRFLPSWHGIDRRATLREALVPLQGLALPVKLWESEVLPRRVPNYQPLQLDQLCASGELVWVGAGLDRVALFFREDAGVLGRPAAAAPPETEAAQKIREALARRCEVLARPRRGDRARARRGAARALGSRLGGRGAQRRLDAAARGEALRGSAAAAPSRAPLLATAREREHGDAGPVVAHRQSLRGSARPPCARGAAPRAAGDRHARRRARRRDPGRLRRGVRRASCARDARRLPPRLLRRGARRCAVRARRRCRATARAATARRRRARRTRARRG